MNLSRLITGLVLIISGAIFIGMWFFIATFIWGIIFILLGFFILLNNKEDEIEKIKYSGRKK